MRQVETSPIGNPEDPEKGILVESLVGYDISSDQIEVANSVDNDRRLTFEQKDILTLNDDHCFDVVLSLFGLHWIYRSPMKVRV